MNNAPKTWINDKWILSLRGKKNNLDTGKPYAWLVEKELTRKGNIEDVAVVFLTNRECPFHCLMCDLWKNTTDEILPEGVIQEQITHALRQLPAVKHIKLYNSGSFFDPGAIPVKDYKGIADLLKGFETVIVESHPRFIDKKCLNFRDLLKPELEIAIGLETINPVVLGFINKRMTTENYREAVGFLSANGIRSRAFILLKPPFMTEPEGILWAGRSVDFAFDCGADCCTIIPVRAGNGAMEQLTSSGHFSPPRINSLEKALESGIRLGKGRVFADLWDLKLFSDCEKCFDDRHKRLIEMNHTQIIPGDLKCTCNSS
jgi:radical SAM enzyme (TIGR01210 family)